MSAMRSPLALLGLLLLGLIFSVSASPLPTITIDGLKATQVSANDLCTFALEDGRKIDLNPLASKNYLLPAGAGNMYYLNPCNFLNKAPLEIPENDPACPASSAYACELDARKAPLNTLSTVHNGVTPNPAVEGQSNLKQSGGTACRNNVIRSLNIAFTCASTDHKFNEKRGLEAIPNYEFWCELPSYLVDGCRFTYQKTMGLFGRE
ncbi:hypothetical protein H696_00960 [Fonticula alba]|uniref:MRH domain-containing protein n=1 Tax=Fonticula alba TaxID=691883 RepID=A0A058ZHK6_FONAL|nr:hypothetical protein H696_00960 [Fonticula alba]KCV73423.1 hypothetical protein H696_00960 [Fonticula alba]|eukprot:XP_009493124.1 hypothetical protein H696_00960 [Fonticula alba]